MTGGSGADSTSESVAIVVVTYNRAAMLPGLLASFAALTRPADAVLIVDNASTDDTADVLRDAAAAQAVGGLQVLTMADNLGGAGGFHAGVRAAYDAGFDRVWLMDDDVRPEPDCLARLLAVDEDALIAVRQDLEGRLCEKAATRFDLRSPWRARPKAATVESTYGERAAMPELVEVENVAFEGFMVRRAAIARVGLPDPRFFIFYDDVDFAVRLRRAGVRILAVRDAVLVRQLDFDQQHDLAGWKGFYMYRNLFVVHLRYGENALVRYRPFLVAAVLVLLSPLRGGRAEASNVIRAMRSAWEMRHPPPATVD